MPLGVELERRGAGPVVAHATNLSVSGACLHLASPLPVGDVVALRLTLPGEPGVIAVRGRVSWCEAPPASVQARFLEAGIRFEVVSEPDRERIAQFVRSFEPARVGAG